MPEQHRRIAVQPPSTTTIYHELTTTTILSQGIRRTIRASESPQSAYILVAEAVDPPKVRREEITPLSPRQSRVLLAAAMRDRFEALYVVALTCGLRQGEILGLK